MNGVSKGSEFGGNIIALAVSGLTGTAASKSGIVLCSGSQETKHRPYNTISMVPATIIIDFFMVKNFGVMPTLFRRVFGFSLYYWSVRKKQNGSPSASDNAKGSEIRAPAVFEIATFTAD